MRSTRVQTVACQLLPVSSEDDGLRTWHPDQVLTYLGAPVETPYACVLLNRPVSGREEQALRLWNGASLRVAVDGGTNVLRALVQSEDARKQPRPALPDVITGDFDSITEETRHFFEQCEFVHTPDQDETDFTKALRVVAERAGGVRWVMAVVDTSGRLDQIMANVNTLFTAARLLSVPVFQVACDSLSWLLAAGRHVIRLPAELRRSWCSLVPVGGPATDVSTSGLQWNLAGDDMRFGQLISTSNRPVADTVTVTTSHPLLFSMEIP
ncbi:thiamin pyrophosphokinase 1-like [Pollicipes pollicipes]|uniref:thiamin pyrophosphokinase 1-like n=1 Tax=Pollicipes pollicipes TaxID=41117 RepID=UPI001884F040|nr:thiamin pyrophosphokinase 1-like [Pollicipes pollicipes]